MKNILYKVSLVTLLATSFVSCKKYLDINENPNAASVVDPKLLFSNATVSLMNNRAGGDLFIPMALAGQSMSGGGNSTGGISWGAAGEDQYIISPFSYGNIWTQYYTTVGFNLQKVIEISENPGEGLLPNNNIAAASKVVLAEMFYELACIYGDVPFSEALDGDNVRNPKFDTQQEVMEGVLGILDEAIAQFDLADDAVSIDPIYDQLYGGNIERWLSFAKAVKLRVLMTMVDQVPDKAAAIGQLVTEGGMLSSSADNALMPFEDVAGKKNPKFAIIEQYNAGINFFYASPYVLDYMKTNNDPRIPIFYSKPAAQADFIAIQPGDNANDAVNAKLNRNFHTATLPEYLFTYQEQLFYEAEIYARGLGVAADVAMANDKYKEAVEESALFFGVAAGEAASFAESLPDLNAGNALTAIHYQHWIDKFDRGVDAFTQWRRSGPEGSEVPALTLPVNAPAGALFRRYEYPVNAELSANPNAPELIRFNVKTWFDL